MTIKHRDGKSEQVTLKLRIDTPIEVGYCTHDGILPWVFRDLPAA